MQTFNTRLSCARPVSNLLLVSGDTAANRIEVTFLIEPVFPGEGVQTTSKQMNYKENSKTS